jgi:hypothetical protein
MKLSDVAPIIVESPGNTENERMSDVPPPSEDNAGLSTAQTAEKLGVTPSRVRQLKAEGRVPGAKDPRKGRPETRIPVKTANKLEREKRKITGRPKGS